MRKQPKRLYRLALVLLAVAVAGTLASTALAQTDVTTTRISGVVKDTDGGMLPGAMVEAKNNETGFTVRAVSDTNGFYRLLNLPSGSYTVAATLSGFATAEKKDLRLVLNQTPTVDFTLALAKVSEAITVTATVPLVEVTSTSAATTLQSEQIASLPQNGRDFTNLVLLTPETRKDTERQGLSISGQRGINTNVTVDGVDFNNAFFGGTAGTAEGRAPLTISQESIKEFSVITNGASVEFGRSGGGFVNVITKNGTNSLKGSLFGYWQPNSMLASRRDAAKSKLNDQDKKQFGASLGGPIMRDRLFFFASFDQQKQTEDLAVASNVIVPELFAKYPALASDPSFSKGTDGRAIFGRLDFQAAAEHRFVARANYADYNGENASNTFAGNGTNYNGIEHMWSRSYVAAYSGMFGANLLNDTNAQYYKEFTPREDKSPTLADVRIAGVRYGGVYFLPIVSTAERKSLADTLTYMFGDHVLKAGFDYNRTTITQTFKGDWRGVYTFNTVADGLAGKWSQFYQFIGLNGLTAEQAGTIDMAQKETALFVQDQWFITPRLTASLGVRWENLDNPNAPILNQNDKNADGSMNMTAHIPDTKNQFSPRIGLTWSPGDAKMVIKFSAGRYWARTPSILWAQLYSSNGQRGARYTINAGASGPTDPLAPGWGSNFNPVGVAPIDYSHLTSSFKGLNVYAVDPDFKNPYTDRFTLSFEQEIFKDTALGFDYTYARGRQLQRLTDLNLQYDIDPATGKPKLASNGMPLYSKTRPNTYYGVITTSVSDGHSEYNGLSATLHRRFTERLFGFASVTYAVDKDDDSNERNYAGIQLEDVNDLHNNWWYSNRDQRWKIALNGTWNTPWWGVSFSGLYRYYSGTPFSAIINKDTNLDGQSATDRPSIGGVHMRRNSFRGPSFQTIDLRLQKAFDLGPGKLSAIGECFNCMNAANETTGSTSTWGTGQTPVSTFGITTATNSVRTIQFALRYDF